MGEVYAALYLRHLSLLGKSAGHRESPIVSYHYRREMGQLLGSDECKMPKLQSFAQISTISIPTIHTGYYMMVAVDALQWLAWSKKGQKYTVGDLQPLIEEFEVSVER